ncbi:hypothetical protein HanPSC8_Chr14g0595621 [Helianthus annuus]|nr:hypothetical protein HanIR_Chr14g0671481 [Helianthus annuus]KAJ0654645.1 hypothetical protein HanLR1_Chr14g0509471 [Helianthus annuus]KAJ0838506.1 hypothetical protein HanPSC8_Chr14g0595621 [Helianthus annuus]
MYTLLYLFLIKLFALHFKKPVLGYKLKEITGSGIFAAGGENGEEDTDAANGTPSNSTGVRMYQQAVAGISHILFGEEETVSPKKSISEAKQRELRGMLDSESKARLKKQISDRWVFPTLMFNFDLFRLMMQKN